MATLEAKLSQQLSGIAHQTLFLVFLDIRKAYDSLDRVKCLEVLRGYGMGPNMDRLLKSYLDLQRIVPNTGKFLGKQFWMGRVVIQGDTVSTMIFKILVDVVVRAVIDVVCGLQDSQHALGWVTGERNVIFSTKNGRIAGRDHK